MAVAFESVQSNTSQDADLVITKPTSLAVGDLLFAGILYSFNGVGQGTINTPSGWTQEDYVVLGSGTGQTILAILRKEADSSDVSASNFTFTLSSDDDYSLAGVLARISDPGILDGNTGSDTNLQDTVTVSTFTPSRANSLFLAVVASDHNVPVGIDSVALATDNPTWTEQVEVSVNDTSRDTNLALYTASRTQDTATGTITGTYANDSSNKIMAVYSLSSRVNGSITPETKVNAYAFNPYNPSVTVNAIVDDPTTAISNTPTQWTNESKPSTTWTNESK